MPYTQKHRHPAGEGLSDYDVLDSEGGVIFSLPSCVPRGVRELILAELNLLEHRADFLSRKLAATQRRDAEYKAYLKEVLRLS